MAEQLTTSENSPDSLPISGYTIDQLHRYIRRQLGEPVWVVELTTQQIIDTINDSLGFFSKWYPKPGFGSVKLKQTQHDYLRGQNVGTVVSVGFVDQVPSPTEIFYGNLISPAPLIRTGLDEYDSFLRWRKTWQRVTSVRPDWTYDRVAKVLWIHNPIERYHCGVVTHSLWTRTQDLPDFGAQWVKNYALAKSRCLYGDILMKFGGAIPGPLRDIQLDKEKRGIGAAEVTKLEDEAKSFQHSVPVMID